LDLRLVNGPPIRETAPPKKLEEGLVIELADRHLLEFEEGILSRVDVDRIDSLWLVEGVVERVAAGRGDHQQAVARAELKRHPVEAGILPAGVVDQVLTVAELKNGLANCGSKHARFLRGTRGVPMADGAVPDSVAV
jgi:hypothetical protein